MCGICGIYDQGGPVDQDVLDRLTDAMAHRGPDGRGTYRDAGLGLGHRRLAILDLSPAGANPMRHQGPDGRCVWITFNGEVYNFLELRDELTALGHRFHSDTDTEVVAAAYLEWNERCLTRFNGMWAFAVWSPQDRSLFLCRDRFGVKPLYYLRDGHRFVFASELKAFLALDGFAPRCDDTLIPRLLAGTASLEGTMAQTLMAKVRRLLPGHSLRVDAGLEPEVRRWWDTRQHLPAMPDRFEDQVEGFREIFLDAVRLRMRSDVPIGTALSGGVDSSAIAATMARLFADRRQGLTRCPDNWRRAFIACFPGTALDERAYADIAARQAGATVSHWTFDADAALTHLVESVYAMEEVYCGIATPAWGLYRQMRRQGTVVSLDGHGCDEMLCGYTSYLDCPIDDLDERLFADFHYNLLPAILRNFDRCAMAHGVEIRMPFMDWRLVTYCFGLPTRAKVGGGFTKRILREAMTGIMHEANRRRRSKIGFNSPMAEWFNGAMAPLIRDILSSPLFLDCPHWDAKAIRARVLAKTDHQAWTMADWEELSGVWTICNIVLWQMLFITRELDPNGWRPCLDSCN